MKKLSKALSIHKATIANLTGGEMASLNGGGEDPRTGTYGGTGTGPTNDTTGGITLPAGTQCDSENNTACCETEPNYDPNCQGYPETEHTENFVEGCEGTC